MTIKEFDQITTAIVNYVVYDSVEDEYHSITRDVSQSADLYRRNMVKLVEYGDAKITHVYCVNNAILVTAVIDSKMESDWIMDDPEHYIMHCSNCNWVNVHGAAWNYCPNCGAAMRENP